MEEKEIEKAKIRASKEWTQKKFGENLFALMRAKGITQKELAKAVDVTATTLSSYKSGAKSPTLPVAAAIAKELGVSLDWLCGMNTESELQTANVNYSNVIQSLVNLNNSVGTIIDSVKVYNGEHSVDEPCIRFNNLVLDHFLVEWKDVKNLLDKGTIGKNIYDPWVAQQLKDYDCPMDKIPEKLTAMLPTEDESDNEEVPF